MPRADKVYTEGLLARLNRAIPNTDGREWIIDPGSVKYGRWWHVCERDTTTGGHYPDIASGRTEYDMQRALAHFLDGYAMATNR